TGGIRLRVGLFSGAARNATARGHLQKNRSRPRERRNRLSFHIPRRAGHFGDVVLIRDHRRDPGVLAASVGGGAWALVRSARGGAGSGATGADIHRPRDRVLGRWRGRSANAVWADGDRRDGGIRGVFSCRRWLLAAPGAGLS